MSFENQQSFESLIESYEGKLSDSDKELISIVLGAPRTILINSLSESDSFPS